MKQLFTQLGLFLISTSLWAQMSLPIQQSMLPKNNLVVNYDFSKAAGFTRGATTATNLLGSSAGNASVVGSPIFMNSLGFVVLNGSQYLMSTNLRNYFRTLNTSVQKSFSMSLWIYPTDLNGIIISEQESQALNSGFFTSNIELVNGVVKYKVWDGTVISSSTLTLNQWHHIAMVYTGNSVKAYLNGTLQGTQTYDRTIPPAGQFYGIGAQSNTNMGSGAYGKFHLAQFKLFNLPLSDSEIRQDYDLRKNEFNYTIHSPSTNSNPTYWNVSSVWNNETTFALQHYTPWLNNTTLGWAALTLDANQWITLNYDEPAIIKGVVLQGRANNGNQWVSKAHVETSATGSAPWTRVLTNATINSNSLDDIRLDFPANTVAKSVRILPVEWANHITLRLGMLVIPNNINSNGLALSLDPTNIKSYSGTGSTLNDLSGNSINATLFNSPTYNGATGLTFNGTTQYGSIPSRSGMTDFTNTQQYSVEVWFNPSSGQVNSGEAELLEKWNLNNESRYPFTIRFNESASSMKVACYDGTNFKALDVTGFPVNTWKHLVAVFDFGAAKTLSVYRDGTLAGSVSLTGIGQVSNTSPIAIATRLNSGGVISTGIMYKGMVGLIRIYNTPLTATQVLQNFNANKSRYGL